MTRKQPRPLPADMLLIEERRRRTTERRQLTPDAAEEILVPDEDQLIEAGTTEEFVQAKTATGELSLYRPVEYISLTQVGWSGPIDHDALQVALLCYPADPGETALRLPIWSVPPFPARAFGPGPALETTLGSDDVAVLRALAARGASAEAAKLIRAACLPERIAGLERSTAQALSPVLAAYRRSSLGYAWHWLLSASESVQLHRECDEAAVALLSTLRALLGER